MKLFDLYLDSDHSDLNKSIGFEIEYEKFIRTILDSEEIKSSELERVRETAWAEMSSILTRKLTESGDNENVLRNLCALVQTLENHARIKSLVEIAFAHVLSRLNDGHSSTLTSLNILVKNLITPHSLNLINRTMLSSSRSEDTLGQFNNELIEGLVKNSPNDSSIRFELVQLFLFVNAALGRANSSEMMIIDKLDHFMFDLAQANQLDGFFEEYLQVGVFF